MSPDFRWTLSFTLSLELYRSLLIFYIRPLLERHEARRAAMAATALLLACKNPLPSP